MFVHMYCCSNTSCTVDTVEEVEEEETQIIYLQIPLGSSLYSGKQVVVLM